MPKKRLAQPNRARATKRKVLQQPQAQQQEQTQEQATETETTNVVSQQQSQELTQSLLLASISSILHLRDLVHPACFRLTYFDVESSEPWSYENWKSGNMKTAHNHHTQSMYLLQRDGSTKTQAFMDYIEDGAFDAIRKGFLRAFQLKIFADPDRQENVLETHTLHFSYHRPVGTADNVVNGIEMTGPEGKRLSLMNLKIGLAEFVRSLSTYVNDLPELPEKRYFKPKVFYTEDCPDEYQAPGFIPPKTAVVNFPQNEELVKETHNLDSYNGGFHNVKMTISHVQWLHRSDGVIPPESDLIYSEPVPVTSGMVTQTVESNAPLQDREVLDIATGLVGQKLPDQAQEFHALSEGLNAPRSVFRAAPQEFEVPTAESPIFQRDITVHNARHALDGFPDSPKPRRLDQVTTLQETSQGKEIHTTISVRESSSAVPVRSSQTLDNGPENPRQDHASVQGGTRVSSTACNDPAIQRNATRSWLDSQDRRERMALKGLRQKPESQAHDTQLVGHDSAAVKAANARTQEHNRLKLTRTKIEELNEKKRLRDTGGLTIQSKKNKVSSTDEILCQCGWNQEEEDNMIYCNWCGTWQHCSCYGFQGASDLRIPHEHACYGCLEDVAEAVGARRRLKELKNFTLLRRAIRTIEETGFHDEVSFAKALGNCDLQTASDVLARLLSEKAVVISDAGKKRTFNKTKGSRYQVVTTALARSEMMDRFFDPLYNVGDYYALENHDPSVREPSAALAGLTDHSPILEKGKRRLRSQPELSEVRKDDDLRKRTLKNAGDGLNNPRPTKRINHGSPMAFTRGMSADL